MPSHRLSYKCLYLTSSNRHAFLRLFLLRQDVNKDVSRNYTTVCLVTLKCARLYRRDTSVKIITNLPRLIGPTKASTRKLNYGGGVLRDTDTVRDDPPLNELIKSGSRHKNVVMTTVDLTVSAFLYVEIIALNGNTFSFVVRLFRCFLVLGNDRIPHLRVRAIKNVDDHLGSGVRVFYRGLLFRVNASTATYLSDLWYLIRLFG